MKWILSNDKQKIPSLKYLKILTNLLFLHCLYFFKIYVLTGVGFHSNPMINFQKIAILAIMAVNMNISSEKRMLFPM